MAAKKSIEGKEPMPIRERVAQLVASGKTEPKVLADILHKEGYRNATGGKLSPFGMRFYMKAKKKAQPKEASKKTKPKPKGSPKPKPYCRMTMAGRVQRVLTDPQLGGPQARINIALLLMSSKGK